MPPLVEGAKAAATVVKLKTHEPAVWAVPERDQPAWSTAIRGSRSQRPAVFLDIVTWAVIGPIVEFPVFCTVVAPK